MKKTLILLPAVIMLLTLAGVSLAQPGMKCKMSGGQTAGDAVTLKGEITNVLIPLAQLKSEGKEYTVHLGPLWYWKQENLGLENGAVEMIGEKEEMNGEWHFYPNEIVQGKVEIVLATENGTPKWAASGMGKGHHGQGRMAHGCGGCCGSRKF